MTTLWAGRAVLPEQSCRTDATAYDHRADCIRGAIASTTDGGAAAARRLLGYDGDRARQHLYLAAIRINDLSAAAGVCHDAIAGASLRRPGQPSVAFAVREKDLPTRDMHGRGKHVLNRQHKHNRCDKRQSRPHNALLPHK